MHVWYENLMHMQTKKFQTQGKCWWKRHKYWLGNTIRIKPMRSTGMTGQSSSRGICVIPNTYLQFKTVTYQQAEKIKRSILLSSEERLRYDYASNTLERGDGRQDTYQRTISVSSRGRFCWTHVANPSPTRGFWLGNSPPGSISSRAYGVTQRLCFKKAALLKNLASGPANGKQFEPGTSL